MTAFPLVFITIGMAPVPGVVEIVSDYLEEPVLGKTCAKRDCKNFCNANGVGSECTNGEAGDGCHDNSECDASKGYVCNTVTSFTLIQPRRNALKTTARPSSSQLPDQQSARAGGHTRHASTKQSRSLPFRL